MRIAQLIITIDFWSLGGQTCDRFASSGYVHSVWSTHCHFTIMLFFSSKGILFKTAERIVVPVAKRNEFWGVLEFNTMLLSPVVDYELGDTERTISEKVTICRELDSNLEWSTGWCS
jgi:hypothetical protein